VNPTTAPTCRVLLLTATVTPQRGVMNLTVREPEERRREYEAVLLRALSLVPSAFAGVVLAENSGADLTRFEELAGGRRVEVLPVPAWDGAGNPGRGFLETHLVQEAVRRSRLIDELEPDVIWKMTGRYWVTNMARLVTSVQPGQDLYVNLRSRPSPWADMWVYGVTPEGLSRLGQHVDRLWERDDRPAERELFTVVTELAGQGVKVVPRFGVEPRIEGRRGFDSVSYSSPAQRAKWLLRTVAKRVAPRLWI
jgi:hypothetical protein